MPGCQADDAVGGKACHHQGHEAESQDVVFPVAANVFGENFQGKGPDNRSCERTHTADYRHGEHQELLVEGRDLGRDEQEVVAVEAPCHPRQRARDGEGQHPHAHDIDPQGRRGALVILDGPKIEADIRVDELIEDDQGQQSTAQHDEEVDGLGVDGDQPRHLEPHGPPCYLVFIGDDDAQDFRKPQGGERKVDTTHAQAEHPHPEAEQRCHDGADPDPQPGIDPEFGCQDPRGVGPDPGKGGVGEGDLAGIARQQVPA